MVVGVADHNGWVVLVSAAAPKREPVVLDRRRVPLVETGVPTQPYHHDTLALDDADAERLLRQVRQSIAACTALALDQLSDDLGPRYRVRSIAIRHPPLPRLPATVREAHEDYHVFCRADGMLYHEAICAAARQRDWAVALHHRGEELARAATALGIGAREAERFLDRLKRTLGPPWAEEHRLAFAAAIGVLGARARLRLGDS